MKPLARFLFACIATLASITPAAAHYPHHHIYIGYPRAAIVVRWGPARVHHPAPRPVVVVVKPQPTPPTDAQMQRWAEEHGYVLEEGRDE